MLDLDWLLRWHRSPAAWRDERNRRWKLMTTARFFALLLLLFSTQGCLGPNAFSVNDYRPQTTGVGQVYYQCLQGAQQPHAGGGFAAGGGTAYGSMSSGVVTNSTLLCACMGSEGYTLRGMTGGELFADIAFLPLEIPFALLGATGPVSCP